MRRSLKSYEPTPAQIATATKKIRANWSDSHRMTRASGRPSAEPVSIQVYSLEYARHHIADDEAQHEVLTHFIPRYQHASF